MKHPKSRAERRAVRDGHIARRKFIALNIWRDYDQVPHEGSAWYMQEPGWYQPMEWGKYAKFNLGCGCKQCHYLKYFSEKRKRRRALDAAIFDNIKSFQENFED
jgi:hypothetical protein